MLLRLFALSIIVAFIEEVADALTEIMESVKGG